MQSRSGWALMGGRSPYAMGMAVLAELRIKHYLKNAFIFVPLVFSLNLFNGAKFSAALRMFLAFSLAASFIYVINDMKDRPQDAEHPAKCRRPIAAGVIGPGAAAGLASLCGLGSVAIAGSINGSSLATVLVYMAVNIGYTYCFKNMAVFDVSCIAISFMLRVVAGSIATGVELSNWLLLTVMALSFYLGFGKRRNELARNHGDFKGGATRTVLTAYNLGFLNLAMVSMLTLTIAFYALWSINPLVWQRMGSSKLVYTTFLVVLGLFRYSLIIEGPSHGDPTEVFLADRPLQFLAGLYLLSVLGLIYLH